MNKQLVSSIIVGYTKGTRKKRAREKEKKKPRE